MAPRELPKSTPKVQRTIAKTNTTKKPITLATTASAIKKTMSTRNTTEKTPVKGILATTASAFKTTMSTRNTTEKTPVKVTTKETRQRTHTVPIPVSLATPKPKDKPAPPGSVTKSAKKSWKRRPKPAHSGVPVPEKMKKLFGKQLQDCCF